MEQVTAFKASDGALFSNSDDCQGYEISLLWRSRIDEFTASGLNPYSSGIQSGMCKKIIVSWERFKTGT